MRSIRCLCVCARSRSSSAKRIASARLPRARRPGSERPRPKSRAAETSGEHAPVCGSVGREALHARVLRKGRGLAIGQGASVSLSRDIPGLERRSITHRLCAREPALHDGPRARSLSHPRVAVARPGCVSDRLGISGRRGSFHDPGGLSGGPARGLCRGDLESQRTRRRSICSAFAREGCSACASRPCIPSACAT